MSRLFLGVVVAVIVYALWLRYPDAVAGVLATAAGLVAGALEAVAGVLRDLASAGAS